MKVIIEPIKYIEYIKKFQILTSTGRSTENKFIVLGLKLNPLEREQVRILAISIYGKHVSEGNILCNKKV